MSNNESFNEKGNYEPNVSNNNEQNIDIPIENTEQSHIQSKPQIEEQQQGHDNDINKPSQYNTLDESAATTLARDGLRILHKLEYVLLPRFNARKGAELSNWDLWGPLLICLLLCISVTAGTDNTTDYSFIIIFAIIWVGGLLLTLNAQFLGARIGICQSVCLLGYCVFPILLASVINRFIDLAIQFPPYGRVISVFLGYIWSCFCIYINSLYNAFSLASVGFVSTLVLPEKKFLITYPIFLFFLALSMIVIFI